MDKLIAVIDVETTGLFPRADRILEIAVVVVGPDGRTRREYSSLINPGRDVGPTSLHGIGNADVAEAPSFAEAAKGLVEALDGCVALAAHDARFVRSFLAAEFQRLGLPLPELHTLSTMGSAGGGRPVACCVERARTMARLLEIPPAEKVKLESAQPPRWPAITCPSRPALPRTNMRTSREMAAPTFMRDLLSRVHRDQTGLKRDGGFLLYQALLDKVLEDWHIDDIERDDLVEAALELGLSPGQVMEIHRGYLGELAVAALMDGTVTVVEYDDLRTVARLLGLLPELDKVLVAARHQVSWI